MPKLKKIEKKIILQSKHAVSEQEIFSEKERKIPCKAKTRLKPTATLCELLLSSYDLSAFVASNETFKTISHKSQVSQSKQFVGWRQTSKHITSCVHQTPPFTRLEEAFQYSQGVDCRWFFFIAFSPLVCYTAVFSVVTQRSSLLTAAENRTTFLSLCVCGLTNKPIMYKKFDNTWAAGR